jgi:hypothetical protein
MLLLYQMAMALFIGFGPLLILRLALGLFQCCSVTVKAL